LGLNCGGETLLGALGDGVFGTKDAVRAATISALFVVNWPIGPDESAPDGCEDDALRTNFMSVKMEGAGEVLLWTLLSGSKSGAKGLFEKQEGELAQEPFWEPLAEAGAEVDM